MRDKRKKRSIGQDRRRRNATKLCGVVSSGDRRPEAAASKQLMEHCTAGARRRHSSTVRARNLFFLAHDRTTPVELFSTYGDTRSVVLTSILFQMALTRWAGTGTALKSTAQARPGPACFVPVPGTARQQYRAWAATSAR